MDKARKSELNKAYRARNRDRLLAQQRAYREANREQILAYNRARRPPKPPSTRRSPEGAAVVLLLERAQKASGLTMSDFVQTMQGSMGAWQHIRAGYRKWRETDEGQSLIGNS